MYSTVHQQGPIITTRAAETTGSPSLVYTVGCGNKCILQVVEIRYLQKLAKRGKRKNTEQKIGGSGGWCLRERFQLRTTKVRGIFFVTMARSLSTVGSTLTGPTAIMKAESCGLDPQNWALQPFLGRIQQGHISTDVLVMILWIFGHSGGIYGASS